MKRPINILILFLFLSPQVHAAILDTIGGVNTLLYGIAAGIAALMITMHAVKWKTADNPNDREEAKRGMINVILALILIMIAATLVSVLFVKPPEADAPPTTTTLNNRVSTTTTITGTTSTTTTTTTTIPPEKLLTAKNLVDCVNREKGKLESIEPVSGCEHCREIKCSVFAKEIDPPVGSGLPQYKRLTLISVSVGPYWVKADGTKSVGCKTMQQISDYYGCDLKPVPGHVYFECKSYDNPIKFDCEP